MIDFGPKKVNIQKINSRFCKSFAWILFSIVLFFKKHLNNNDTCLASVV